MNKKIKRPEKIRRMKRKRCDQPNLCYQPNKYCQPKDATNQNDATNRTDATNRNDVTNRKDAINQKDTTNRKDATNQTDAIKEEEAMNKKMQEMDNKQKRWCIKDATNKKDAADGIVPFCPTAFSKAFHDYRIFRALHFASFISSLVPTFCCRYIGHAGKCHYIVDLENSAVTELQPRYADSSNWTVQAGFKCCILLNATYM